MRAMHARWLRVTFLGCLLPGGCAVNNDNIFEAVASCLDEDDTGVDCPIAAATYGGQMADWDTSNITIALFQLFKGRAAFNADIGGWNVSGVGDMQEMFDGALDFNQDIGGWDTSACNSMNSMFAEARKFNQNIGKWDTGRVEAMEAMFDRASSFKQDIGGWDTSRVTTMSLMFRETVFNQYIGNWDVRSVTKMNAMFDRSTVFNQDIGSWDVSAVADFSWFLHEAIHFNQDIGGWDVRRVNDMGLMFRGASNFNKDISGWDVSRVINFDSMFTSATSFNYNISGWVIQDDAITANMFEGATAFQAAYSCDSADDGPPDTCVAKRCDFSEPPEDGTPGDCPSSDAVPVGASCQPSCNDGYYVSGPSRCELGTVHLSATCTVCPAGSYCAAGTGPPVECAASIGGMAVGCPPGSSEEAVCPAGYYCADSMQRAECPSGSWCAKGVSAPTACEDGSECPEGSSEQAVCPAGHYCADNGEKVECPIGYYCLKGSIAPTLCPVGAQCPAGTTANPAQLKVQMIVTLTMDVATFVAEWQDSFTLAVADWLGSGVSQADVIITCMCETSCEVNSGIRPEEVACGEGSAAAGRHARGRILQQASQSETVAVEYEVLVGSAGEQASIVTFATSDESAAGLSDSLEASGFEADVSQSAVLAVYADEASASAIATPSSEQDYTDVLITVLFAVPVAMLVVGLATYQNSKKEKPVGLPGLIAAVLFSFYDFFSDVWFVATPVEREFVGFTTAATVALSVACFVGLCIALYTLKTHEVREWGLVDIFVVLMAVTNPDMLGLLLWKDGSDKYEGMPDQFTSRLPIVGVVVEDLPQLFIQGFYLISSGDTGNVAVLVSVSISGCTLLLRFVRGAFLLARQVNMGANLASTSPMRTWDKQRMAAWLHTLVKNKQDDLGQRILPHIPALTSVPPADLLALYAAIVDAQDDLPEQEEERASKADGSLATVLGGTLV